MNIKEYIYEFIEEYTYEFSEKKKYKRKFHLSCEPDTVRNLLLGNYPYSLKNQHAYEELECLPYNVKECVKRNSKNKKTAIDVYKSFQLFLKGKDIDVNIDFPPIDISNSFERLMFIAKYLQDPTHKISDLYYDDNDNKVTTCILWTNKRTIEDDLAKLQGKDDDPIKICGKVFTIDDMERGRDIFTFKSTAHPLFLSQNLTQILITLKGLKAMSGNKFYAEYARLTAANIWEQLSEYAKERIKIVLTDLLPDDLTWYESLSSPDNKSFKTEYQCSTGNSIVLDCLKNKKTCYLEYQDNDTLRFYSKCEILRLYDKYVEIDCEQGKLCLEYDKIVSGAYSPENLV